MKKQTSFFLAIIFYAILYNPHGLAADLAVQCKLSVPSYNRSLSQNQQNSLPVIITAKNVSGNFPDRMKFTGNVSINYGYTHLHADEMQLYQTKKNDDTTTKSMQMVEALGGVYYSDNQIILQGLRAWFNLSTKDTNIWQGYYQLLGYQGRGQAHLIKQRKKNNYTILELENGSFTSCLPDSYAWKMTGSKILYDREKEIIKIWKARLKLGRVPILYTPYLQLPIGDKRRSGFLTPNIKYSITNYFEFSLPYYWNISPNMDATIIPHYIYKRRNIMWENELRYLTLAGTGLIGFYYLPSDPVFKHKFPTNSSHHRWLYYWQHSGVIDYVWRLNIDCTQVSDLFYFNDFSSHHGSITDSYTRQIFSIGYVTEYFNTTLSVRQFQLLNSQIDSICATRPQIDINWHQDYLGPFCIKIYGQSVYLVNTKYYIPQTIRIHIEPSFSIPVFSNWGSLNTEAKLMATHYQQKKIDNTSTNSNKIKKSINRILPQFKIDGKLKFERDINLANNYIQTFEPRIQYLYVPYRDQSKIYNYDSSLLQFDYNTLFRDRIYSGLDRIASVNQVKTAITSRILDSDAVERFNISIGQIYNFTQSSAGDKNINDQNINLKKNNKTGSLIWASNTYWRMSNRLGLYSTIQYNADLNNIAISSTSFGYRYDKDRMIQLSHRYICQEYFKSILSNNSNLEQYNTRISQAGGVISWPVMDRWSIVGAYYFNTDTNKMVNQKLGVQYNSCCYMIRIGYERKLNGWNTSHHYGKYNNIITFNFELRGLNSKYDIGIEKMLNSNILPYRNFI